MSGSAVLLLTAAGLAKPFAGLRYLLPAQLERVSVGRWAAYFGPLQACSFFS